MYKFIIIFIALFLTLGTTLYANGLNDNSSTDEINVIGVKMDADWCGKCKVMNPKLDSIMPEFKDDDILFVKFNMTDEFTTRQAGLLAERLNLKSLFEEHKGSTGYMVLLNADTGEVLHTLQSDQSEDDLIRDIRSTLETVQS
ncbi:hypothetical protein BH23BAC3_BH23BAC3_12060 [soil metagenome]